MPERKKQSRNALVSVNESPTINLQDIYNRMLNFKGLKAIRLLRGSHMAKPSNAY